MKFFLIIFIVYIVLGVVFSSVICYWAKRHGESATVEDFAIFALLYPYYVIRLLKQKF